MGSIARPFRWNAGSGGGIGAGLKEMSDADLEYLSYYFRLYYAAQLNTGHNGSCYYDASGTHSGANYPRIGSVFRTIDTAALPDTANWHHPAGDSTSTQATDQRKNMLRNTAANNDDGGSGGPAPESAGDPGTGAFDGTRSIKQSWRTIMPFRHANSTKPDRPSDATYEADGYIVQNAAGNFQIYNDVANIVETILKHSNSQMISGDELGTYRVATSSPGSDWTVLDGSGNNEYMFQDTLMNYTASSPGTEGVTNNTPFKLYLKTSFTFAGATTSAALTEPFGWDTGNGGSLKQRSIAVDAADIATAANIVKNILYPIYVQEELVSSSDTDNSSYGYPTYSWTNSSSIAGLWEEHRGTVTDTYFTGSALRQDYLVGPAPSTYYTDRYGSGALTSVLWYFKMSLPSTKYIMGTR